MNLLLLLLAAVPASAGTVQKQMNFAGPDGLVTNSYAYSTPGDPNSVKSEQWIVTNGSLFSAGGQGYTGVPDDVVPNATSSNGTGSATFRALTKESFGDQTVTFTLVNNGLTSTPSTPENPANGVRVIFRYQGTNSFYALDVNRRDNIIVIKKRTPAPSGNGGVEVALGTARAYPVPYGTAQDVRASVSNNRDGTVSLNLTVNGTVASTVDSGINGAPFHSGQTGLRGDNDEFHFYGFAVSYPAADPPGPLDLVRAYPNPWRADRNAASLFTFDNLPAGSVIKIFTLSGRLVTTLQAAGTSATWALTNDGGEKVGSGFYLYRIEGGGDKKGGKLAIVR